MGGTPMTKYIICLTAIGLLFSLPLSAQQEERERPRDSFYERRAVEERTPVELPYVREADILWSKRIWQVIDVREKINQPLYFPEEPTGQYKSLMQVLQEAILAGEVRAYGVDDENFQDDPIPPRELFRRFSRTVSFMQDGETTPTTVTIPFEPSEVIRWRIKEEWFIDSRRGMLDVRIIGISPAREVTDDQTGEFLGFEPLFWVYFPEARQVLANAPVYNRMNSAQRISFDDFFVRRFFNATIYREERPDNRVISEYFEDPIDALLEGQRIREMIRNFEMDLWHY